LRKASWAVSSALPARSPSQAFGDGAQARHLAHGLVSLGGDSVEQVLQALGTRATLACDRQIALGAAAAFPQLLAFGTSRRYRLAAKQPAERKPDQQGGHRNRCHYHRVHRPLTPTHRNEART
jgi:hypothetical protein